jgi:hypothetical protein
VKLDQSKRLQELAGFLKNYEAIYQKEFLKNYPDPYPESILPWLIEMRSWSDEKLALFESFPHEDLATNEEFKGFLKSIRELSTLQATSLEKTKLPKSLTTGLGLKKQHELEFIKTKLDQSSLANIIDIGGGVGHTSFCAVYKTTKKIISYDLNQKLQDKGQERIKSLKELAKDQVVFIKKEIIDDIPLLPKTPFLSIGLHCCGDLSVSLIKNHLLQGEGELISFGCCYHKMVKGQNLSTSAKPLHLHFSTNALHLASRCGKKIRASDIIKRKLFKRHRYTLHYYMFDNFEAPFRGIGNSSPKSYQNTFSSYAKSFDCYPELKDVSPKELDDFYKKDKTLQVFKDNFNADLLRLLLGRLIEIYILLDRALYLAENDQLAELTEVFDPTLSPRNIMLESTSLKR